MCVIDGNNRTLYCSTQRNHSSRCGQRPSAIRCGASCGAYVRGNDTAICLAPCQKPSRILYRNVVNGLV